MVFNGEAVAFEFDEFGGGYGQFLGGQNGLGDLFDVASQAWNAGRDGGDDIGWQLRREELGQPDKCHDGVEYDGWQSQVLSKDGNVMTVLIEWITEREPPAAQDLKPQAVALPAQNRPAKLFGLDDENAKLGTDYVIDLSRLASAGVDWHHQVVEVVIRRGEFGETIAH